MCGRRALCWLILFLRELVLSISITELTVPSHAVESDSALLECHYDLEEEMLYSINWYKDGTEFYKYVPSNSIQYQYFPQPGVDVDENDSSSNVVKLVNLTSASAGLYRCEVSGEGPYFITKMDERNISVHLLPHKRPQVLGLQDDYKVGDLIAVNCTSSRSRPQTQLKWLINSEAASRRLITGPWYRISRERPDARETILQLRFILKKEHFKNGILQLKCQATIAPLYQDEAVHHIVRAEDNVADAVSDLMNEEIDRLFDQHAHINTVTESRNYQDRGEFLKVSISSITILLLLQLVL